MAKSRGARRCGDLAHARRALNRGPCRDVGQGPAGVSARATVQRIGLEIHTLRAAQIWRRADTARRTGWSAHGRGAESSGRRALCAATATIRGARQIGLASVVWVCRAVSKTGHTRAGRDIACARPTLDPSGPSLDVRQCRAIVATGAAIQWIRLIVHALSAAQIGCRLYTTGRTSGRAIGCRAQRRRRDAGSSALAAVRGLSQVGLAAIVSLRRAMGESRRARGRRNGAGPGLAGDARGARFDIG
jgi:hypothetical protein